MKKSEKARRDANPNGGFGRNQKDARGDAEHAEEKLHIHFPPSPRPPRLRVTLSSRNPQATRPWRLKSLQRIRKHQKAKSHAETRRTRRKNSIFISLSLRALRASACPLCLRRFDSGLPAKRHVVVELQQIRPATDILPRAGKLGHCGGKVFQRFRVAVRSALIVIRAPLRNHPRRRLRG